MCLEGIDGQSRDWELGPMMAFCMRPRWRDHGDEARTLQNCTLFCFTGNVRLHNGMF
jgi:hypothetical protein